MQTLEISHVLSIEKARKVQSVRSKNRPAHNAALRGPFLHEENKHHSIYELYEAAKKSPAVSVETFSVRLLTRFRKEAALTSEVISECLYSSVESYQRARSTRRSLLADQSIDPRPLNLIFADYEPKSVVAYSTFRTRIRSLEKREIQLSPEYFQKAACYQKAEWDESFGGGRRLPIHIDGKSWPSLKAYVASIGREADYRMIVVRIRKGWSLENALEPRREKGGGWIYQITQISTGLHYFGLTTVPPQERWRMHKAAALEPRYPLHIAMSSKKENNFEDFNFVPLFEVNDDQALA